MKRGKHTCKRIQDSRLLDRFHAVDFGLQPSIGILILWEWKLDSEFQFLVGFLIPWDLSQILKPRIPQPKIPRIPESPFPRMGQNNQDSNSSCQYMF